MKLDQRKIVIRALNRARIKPYLNAVDQNEKQALSLYQWHLDLTASVQSVLGVTEVILRNAMDHQLQLWNTAESGKELSWLLDEPEAPLRSLTNNKRKSALKRARGEANQRSSNHPRFGHPIDHNDVLAQVMFGMWKDLLPNHSIDADPLKIENLNRVRIWQEALIKAFPHIADPDGEKIYWWVANLHRLRNRVSHMEPLLNVDINNEIKKAFKLVRSINPVVADWVTGSSKVAEIVRNRPGILKK